MMTAMSEHQQAPDPVATHVHTLRSRGSVVIGVVLLVAAIGLLAFGWGSELGYLAGVALVGALGYVLLVRPCVRVSVEGVAVHNPFRTTFVPWRLVEDVVSRWNLEVYAAERRISAWAISAHLERPKADSPFGLGSVFGRLPVPDGTGGFDSGRRGRSGPSGSSGGAERPANDPDAPGGMKGAMTAQRAKRLIEAAKAEWEEAVADGVIVEPAAPSVVRRWETVDLVAVGIPLAAVLVAVVIR